MLVTCVKCKTPILVSCTALQYADFIKGRSIQYAMPNVPPEERELLISGICDSCWRRIFKNEEKDTR